MKRLVRFFMFCGLVTVASALTVSQNKITVNGSGAQTGSYNASITANALRDAVNGRWSVSWSYNVSVTSQSIAGVRAVLTNTVTGAQGSVLVTRDQVGSGTSTSSGTAHVAFSLCGTSPGQFDVIRLFAFGQKDPSGFWPSDTGDIVIFDTLQPQSITVNLQSSDNLPRDDGAHPRGTTFVLKATGGHNDYVWELRPAPGYSQSGGGLIINSTTDEAIAYVTGLGVYEIACYNEGGNGYEQSPEEVYTVTTYSVWKSRIPISNGADHDMIFRFYHEGALIREVTLSAGESRVEEFVVESASPISVRTVDPIVGGDGVVWTPRLPDDVIPVDDEVDVGEFTPVDDLDPEPAEDTATATAPKTEKPPVSTVNVWSSITNDNKDEAVTARVYAEGVGQLVEALTSGKSVFSDPETDDYDEDTSMIDPDAVRALGDALPDAPEIQFGGTSSVIGFSYPLLNGSGTGFTMYSTSYDVSDYSGPIGVIRTMARGLLAVVFFFVYVRVIKSAFAGH